MRIVTPEEARRIAVRAQLLDGSATTVLDTVRRLGFLQLDPIATVATPQHLVLWSRLGAYDIAELDRLLWDEKKLYEWNAFIWPIESLPMVRGMMRRRRTSTPSRTCLSASRFLPWRILKSLNSTSTPSLRIRPGSSGLTLGCG